MGLDFQIRWMVRHDLEKVIIVENLCFDYPWNKQRFLLALDDRRTIGYVVEQGDKIIGYSLHRLYFDFLTVTSMAIHPEHQRRGIGGLMLEKFFDRRQRVTAFVSEYNLPAQLFFKAEGFYASKIVRDYFCYGEKSSNAYFFQKDLRKICAVCADRLFLNKKEEACESL